jgi:membrane protein DedA with SNARE-associated domain
VLILGLHFFHHIHGTAVDYVGVGVAAFISWAGLPGPGESVLIATGILSYRHHLDITPVLLWATVGAVLGGTVGWIVGVKAGRAALTAPGPLHTARLRAAERGDEVFQRLEVIAILLTPSWVAGIYRARAGLYLPVNAVSAVVWAFGFGLGAYYIGPPVLDAAADLGTLALVGLVALIAVGVGLEVARRVRRRRENERLGDEAGETPPPIERSEPLRDA